MTKAIEQPLKRYFGNEIIESSDGHRKIIKKDIFGNTVIEDY